VSPENDSSMSATCEVTFAVTVPPPPPPAPAPETKADRERDFRANVHDVYFDLNKSTLRPDAIETIKQDAEYLLANPDVVVTIGGFADQRGSSQYNLALGERRAHAVKDKLVEDGVPADHVQIVTFGRDAQTCTANEEDCWQKNRRVGFLMRP
jgi:peptidoglycan-associated lipoprotein